MAAVFHDEPLFASLRFAGVVLEQGALADSGRGPVGADVTPPQLSAQCVDDLRGLGSFRDERDALRRVSDAKASEDERAKAVSRVAARRATRSESNSAFTQVQGSRSSTSAQPAAALTWACPECTLVNRAEDSKCDACTAARPAGAAALGPGDAALLTFTGARPGTSHGPKAAVTTGPQPGAEWACQRCTTLNSAIALACSACEEKRSTAAPASLRVYSGSGV